MHRDGDISNKWDTSDTSEFRVPSQITPRYLKGAGCDVIKVMFDQARSEIITVQVVTRLDELW